MVDDSTNPTPGLNALDDFIAAVEAEVARLAQLEREAEAQLARLRLAPPRLLWPAGVTLRVEAAGTPAGPAGSTIPPPAPPLQPLTPARRRPSAEPPPVPPTQPLAHQSKSTLREPAPSAEPDRPVEAAPADKTPEAPTATFGIVPVTPRSRPKTLMEALS